jgi:hypothetical protein
MVGSNLRIRPYRTIDHKTRISHTLKWGDSGSPLGQGCFIQTKKKHNVKLRKQKNGWLNKDESCGTIAANPRLSKNPWLQT